MTGIFISGTDTGAGKTCVGVHLTRHLYRQGVDVQPRKPVETGCLRSGNALMPADALAYHQAVNRTIALSTICPWRYRLAASPAEAAKRENRPLALEQLIEACAAPPGAVRIIEGAGGFYSPIAQQNALNADLAQALDLDVLLVARNRLGVINQALLTAEAIERRGLKLRAVILNQADTGEDDLNNAIALRELLAEPVITLGHDPSNTEWQTVFSHIGF